MKSAPEVRQNECCILFMFKYFSQCNLKFYFAHRTRKDFLFPSPESVYTLSGVTHISHILDLEDALIFFTFTYLLFYFL